MRELSPAVQHLLAVGLLLLAVLALLFYAVMPLVNYYSTKWNEVDQKQRQLARYQSLLASEGSVDQQLARMQEADSVSDLFLSGSRPAIASANLREFVVEAVRASGGDLISSQNYEAEPIDATTAVGLNLRVMGEVPDLIKLLHSVETARPIIFIDTLNVNSSSTRVVVARNRRSNNRQVNLNTLDISMSIVGYLVGEDPENETAE